MTEAIIEVAARALRETDVHDNRGAAKIVLAAVTPLIRDAALEEAAMIVDDYSGRDIVTRKELVARIRALKEQP